MKPIMIIPPASSRWPAVQRLFSRLSPTALDDLERRVQGAIPQAQDAFAMTLNGADCVAAALVCKRFGVGVLGNVFTRRDHRRRGLALKCVEAAAGWFDMNGGRRLYLACAAEQADLFVRAGFRETRRVDRGPLSEITMCRDHSETAAPSSAPTAQNTPNDPVPTDVSADVIVQAAESDLRIRDITRADWPAMVGLLHEGPGADPRVPIAESAVSAEHTMLELLDQQDRNETKLIGAWRDESLAALATLATPPDAKRTFAAIMPHDAQPRVLRDAVLREADDKTYERVEFPMDALRTKTK